VCKILYHTSLEKLAKFFRRYFLARSVLFAVYPWPP